MSSTQGLLTVDHRLRFKLARDGVRAHRLVGNRHRFLLEDVLAHQQVAQDERSAALAALVPVGGYDDGDL